MSKPKPLPAKASGEEIYAALSFFVYGCNAAQQKEAILFLMSLSRHASNPVFGELVDDVAKTLEHHYQQRIGGR